jgi:hypothetical protein
MDMRFTDADLKHMAFDIAAQCRDECPGQVDEAIMAECEAVIYAEGLNGRDADKLREFCELGEFLILKML